MIHRRRFLAAAAGALAFPAQAQELRTLRGMAAARGLMFGSAAATYQLRDPDFPPLLTQQAAMLVPEYEMKRDALEPQPGRYDFAALDALFRFAARNGLAMRGHPLVWDEALPPWLAPALAARRDEKLLTGHVQAVLGRYRMASVDVVNEALAQPDSGNIGGLRPSPWLSAFGPGYVDLAFHAARAADPHVRLVYNDYNCEPGSSDRFRAATLNFLDGLLKRGVPLDALGLQGHLSAFRDRVDQAKLHAFLNEVRARGLGILVTELDVDDTGGALDPGSRDRAVADETRRFLDVVLDNPACSGVLTWGLSDRYLAPPQDWKHKMVGWRSRKLPFDTQLAAKPMWQAMAQAFAGRRIAY